MYTIGQTMARMVDSSLVRPEGPPEWALLLRWAGRSRHRKLNHAGLHEPALSQGWGAVSQSGWLAGSVTQPPKPGPSNGRSAADRLAHCPQRSQRPRVDAKRQRFATAKPAPATGPDPPPPRTHDGPHAAKFTFCPPRVLYAC